MLVEAHFRVHRASDVYGPTSIVVTADDGVNQPAFTVVKFVVLR